MATKKATEQAEQLNILDAELSAPAKKPSGKKAVDGKYDNSSIKALKGADRVRKRPAVIFGSDDLEGCKHAFFEILSNSVDEAREGNGDTITVTAWRDHSITVDDRGRGVPLGYNEAEGRWNWDLIYCELYAGGKYDNNEDGGAYEYSLGLNGLGACATQYSSEYMEVFSYDGKNEYSIRFAKGEVQGELNTRPLSPKEKRTGTVQHWLPDLEVFTDIAIPPEFFEETMRRQSMVNPGVTFVAFPNGLATISAHAFADTGLTGLITLPSTVTSVDDTAFSGCDVTIEITPAE